MLLSYIKKVSDYSLVRSTKSVLANQNIFFNTILNLSETVKPQKPTTISNFQLKEYQMAKGYLMANLRVNDQDIFKEFSSVALPLIESFGGKLLARGPHADRHEGSVSGIVTLIEFESKEAAENFYFSDEYQAAKAIRDKGVDTDLMIIEGM